MMKEFIILGVVTFFSLVTYYLVEPYAHHVMHPHVDSKHFAYADLPALEKVGNAEDGANTFMAGGCIGCHNVESIGMMTGMDALASAQAFGGVNPPDLSNAGTIYDEKFLADLIRNPAHATMVEHKFSDVKPHPMPPFYGAGGDMDQEVADIVAYLKSIAKPAEEITPAMAYNNACGRCHSLKYEGWTQMGEKPNFKYKKDELRYDANVLEYQEGVTKYMGKLPPDLSMYYKSRGAHFIETFIEDPQTHLEGTAMPRVGVTADSAEKIVEHLADSADTKRVERESIAKNVMIYLLIFTIFAYLWKRQVWKELH